MAHGTDELLDRAAGYASLLGRIEVYATTAGLDPVDALGRIRAALTDFGAERRGDAYAAGYVDGLAKLSPDPAHNAFPKLRAVPGGAS